MIKIKKTKINAYIIALYVFQFGLLQPIASLVNSQWPIAAFTLILLVIMFLYNGIRIKKYVIIALTLISIHFLLNTIIFKKNVTIISSIYLDFLLKGFSAFIVGSLLVRGEELGEAFLKISVLNFFAIVLVQFVSFLD